MLLALFRSAAAIVARTASTGDVMGGRSLRNLQATVALHLHITI
jgi:hypothetical protein